MTVNALNLRPILAVALLCSLLGSVLSLSDAGGAPMSAAAYLYGCAAAAKLLFPALITITVAAILAPSQPVPRAAMLAVAVTVGVAIGYVLMTGLPQLDADWRADRLDFFTAPLEFFGIGWLGVVVFLLQERDQRAKQLLHDEMQRQLEAERQMSEAQLQMLQSQVEPHFLFNTLAHIRRLYLTAPPAGATMMRDLVRYLGTALPALRHTGITLGEDVELAVAYLNLQKIRMGPRLTFEVDIPAAAGDARVPPMMITTLVENAVKHGLYGLPAGGTVRISATPQADRLAIKVSDTGAGLRASLGTGVGLANLRARLAILHGAAAELALSRNTPAGVTVTVLVPRCLAEAER